MRIGSVRRSGRPWRSPSKLKPAVRGNDTRRRSRGDIGRVGASTARWQFMSGNPSTPDDPLAVMRSRRYLGLLVLAAILGVPISAAAYWFLWAINHGRHGLFEALPAALGLTPAPAWWPLPVVAVGGFLAGMAIAYL